MATNGTLRGVALRIGRTVIAGAIVATLVLCSQGTGQAAERGPAIQATAPAATSTVYPAAAKRWSYHGSKRIKQVGPGSGHTLIYLEIDQTGSKLNGTARYNGGSGRLTGSITGNTITFTVTWNSRSVGVYTGVFRPDGSIRNGNTYDRKHPTVTASWSTY